MPSFEEEFKEATHPGPGRKIPGAVLIAADRSGQIRYLKAEGFTSVEPAAARPILPDSTFWIASFTKLLTTVAALQCVEKGLLSLDGDVSGILPEWKSPDILTGFDAEGEPMLKKATKKITLRLLLTHSSGMSYVMMSPELRTWQEWTKVDPKAAEGDIVKQYATPLLFEPGESWSYGCGLDWVGQMVERVNGGLRLGEYMKTHIWDPLGMDSTTFRITQHEGIQNRLCSMTSKTPEGELVPSPALRTLDPKDDLGGGGLYASPTDYLKVLVALLKNDGTLLKPETVKLMFEPQLPDDRHLRTAASNSLAGPIIRGGVDSDAWNFGLGGILNMEDVDGVCKKGTMTWGGLPNLFWWIDPAAETCGLYASQLVPPGDPDSIALALAFRKDAYTQLVKV